MMKCVCESTDQKCVCEVDQEGGGDRRRPGCC